ncbi:MAG: ABC transporter ATP-binding protein/permease [Lachnospiraceae bacterium]|nr:ABC transporter ATP-binding protein/permease [Lachnospiraceae bacterium]
MFILVLMMLFGGIMESLSVSLMLPLVTAIMDADSWGDKWYAQIICNLFHVSDQRRYVVILLGLLMAIFILKNLYLIWEYRIQYNFIGGCRYLMQSELIHSYIRKPYPFYLTADHGEIVRIIDSDVTGAFNLLTNVLSFYTEIIVSVILGITITIMSPMMAGGMIIILLLELLLITKVVKPFMRRTGDNHREQAAIANKWLLQSLNGIKSIKVSNKEVYFEENYKTHAKQNSRLIAKYQTYTNLPRLLIEAFTIAGILLIMLILVLFGSELESLVPQLSAFIVAAIRLLPSVNRMSTSINQVPFYEGGVDAIIVVIKNLDVTAATDGNEQHTHDIANISFHGGINFEKISYHYPNSDKNVLDKAEMKISVGESVGIIGPSGSGKTTTVDIILGLLDPTNGRVTVDGIDIRRNLSAWLSHLAYIPQSIFLMDDTIRANVAFGIEEKEVSDKKVMEALKEAQLGDFIKDLPNGINTTVGEQGVRLSGGQRQRIGIARALYNNPDVLFFDEATSALDNETEAAIMESINHLKGRKTLIIIAHRLTTIDNCDVVYRVENGKILKERG